MDHIEAIDAGLDANAAYADIARKIYLTYPTKAFIGAEERQYEVVSAVAKFFDVPITAIQVAGSAKTGYSFWQKTEFKKGESDLDIAIVDTRLFVRYAELVFTQSKGFADQSRFPIRDGKSTYDQYVSYLARGIFRPDLMTMGTERAEWTNFFGTLSGQHSDLFGSITACIYLSEQFFVSKQRATIKRHSENKAKI